MIEVPYDEPVKKQMTNLDIQLQTVMNNENLSVEDKYERYQQVLRRYRYLQDEMKKPIVMYEDSSIKETVKETAKKQEVTLDKSPIKESKEPFKPIIGTLAPPTKQIVKNSSEKEVGATPKKIKSDVTLTSPGKRPRHPKGFYNDKKWLEYK